MASIEIMTTTVGSLPRPPWMVPYIRGEEELPADWEQTLHSETVKVMKEQLDVGPFPSLAAAEQPRQLHRHIGAMWTCCSGSTAHTSEEVIVLQTGVTISAAMKKRLGWKRDLPDFRDRVLALPAAKKENLPPQVDLRPAEHFGIYDQGNLGSCTANALCAAFHFDQIKEGVTDFTPSRLFLYYNERAMEGNIGQDAGAYLRDGIKSLNKIGICPELMWPYDISTFTDKPIDKCYDEATKNTAKEYARVPQTLEDLKACVAAGFPFVFGFAVLSSFFTEEVTNTGMMPMPQPNDYVLGGHAVQACGYDDEKQVFIVRNSWGESWGDKGYFYMPYDYIVHQSLAADFWAIKFVDSDEFPCKKK